MDKFNPPQDGICEGAARCWGCWFPLKKSDIDNDLFAECIAVAKFIFEKGTIH